jgi:thiazole synthase
MNGIFHCFGNHEGHRVDSQLAVAMLEASGCEYLALNTHGIEALATADDLPVGYAGATFGSVRRLLGAAAIQPVLNINRPTSATEAVDRARRAVDLSGVPLIKLEVLSDDLTWSNNDAVLAAAEVLRLEDGLEVWPLLAPDLESFERAAAWGCAVIRVMGSPIGSRCGIARSNRDALERIALTATCPIMLDGGIGRVADIEDALALGFDAVLVNSCLFCEGADPVARLREFRDAVRVSRRRHRWVGAGSSLTTNAQGSRLP